MKALPRLLFLLTIIAFAVIFIFIKPIAQPLAYHSFSDTVFLFNISNFSNVISNIGFVVVGIWGVIIFSKNNINDFFTLVISLGFILTGIGSAYYHYNPNNATLVWDRLPMTIVFTTFFAQTYSLFINKKTAKKILLICLPLGIFSVWYWHYTETLGNGDLRLYALVQYLPMLLLVIIISLHHKKQSQLIKHYVLIGAFYFIAKIFENYDKQLHEIFKVIGGHPIKHIAASIAAFFIIKLSLKKNKQFSN